METIEKVDILAFGAHPDDVELSCSGTLAAYIAKGKKVAIVDLTKGEMGTRGTVETRFAESEAANKILGISLRINLGLPDCGLTNSSEQQLKLIHAIRLLRPDIVLCNAPHDRHPDHGAAAKLQTDACFYAGIEKIVVTDTRGIPLKAHRPRLVFHYIQDQYIHPDLVIDITPFFDKKMESIKAYKTQFFDPESTEPKTYISDEKYFDYIRARAITMGHMIGTKYGEGFIKRKMIGLHHFDHLL